MDAIGLPVLKDANKLMVIDVTPPVTTTTTTEQPVTTTTTTA